MPSMGKRKRGRIRKRSEGFGSVNHFRKVTKKDSRKAEGHSVAEKKSGERPNRRHERQRLLFVVRA